MSKTPSGQVNIQIKATFHGKCSSARKFLCPIMCRWDKSIMGLHINCLSHCLRKGWPDPSHKCSYLLLITWQQPWIQHGASICSVIKRPIFLLLIEKPVFYSQNTTKLQWLEKTEYKSILKLRVWYMWNYPVKLPTKSLNIFSQFLSLYPHELWWFTE